MMNMPKPGMCQHFESDPPFSDPILAVNLNPLEWFMANSGQQDYWTPPENDRHRL
jgi:hypothetical protein